ncbi:DUF4286 family protein [Enterovirga rhinocerotis]|uniref:EthD domain-containing protein n=1 Tax=Enterovirga rhinocerotis TaxID=1339210 RepID=A0A4R7CBK7_9HYPH|nr:DUF4286 family protein [Enterovirga rhinocerotis]TDR94825.1 hypothetical protein EV668_2114 [Enterovirga rhinocerotis]
MPVSGKGMLLTTMDIPPEHEAEFNEWYDREHLAERVAIPGFLEARRYIAVDAAPKYLGLYSTGRFDDLSSPAYKHALANQTEWSKTNLARFKNMGRAVARITASGGQGRGGVLAMLRLRPRMDEPDALRRRIAALFKPAGTAGVIAMHLLENDPALSVSLTEPDAEDPGAGDWRVLVDGSDIAAVLAFAEQRLVPALGAEGERISLGTYRLLWDLAKADL